MTARLPKRLLLSVVTILLMLVFAELGLRMLLPAFTYEQRLVRPAEGLAEELSAAVSNDPLLHHGYKPNARFSFVRAPSFDVSYRTNSMGFRGEEFQVPKPPGVVRIVFMGDSFTEGVGVEEDERFTALLQDRFDKRGEHIQVLNCGMSSYSPILYYRLWQVVAAKLAPDLVVVMLDNTDPLDDLAREGGLGDDPVPDYPKLKAFRPDVSAGNVARMVDDERRRAEAYRSKGGVKQFLRSHSAIFLATYLVKRRKFFPDLGRSLSGIGNYTRDSEQYRDLYARSRRYLSMLADETQGKLVLVTAPWGMNVSARQMGKLRFLRDIDKPPYPCFFETWTRLWPVDNLSADHIIHLTPLFREADLKTHARFFYEYDPHWTPEGHRLVADLLEDRLLLQLRTNPPARR